MSAWIVKWRLLGSPRELPPVLFKTIPESILRNYLTTTLPARHITERTIIGRGKAQERISVPMFSCGDLLVYWWDTEFRLYMMCQDVWKRQVLAHGNYPLIMRVIREELERVNR